MKTIVTLLLTHLLCFSTGTTRATYAVALGHLAWIQKHPDEAKTRYQEALTLVEANTEAHFGARLGLARLSPEAQRLEQLQAIASDLDQAPQALRQAQLKLLREAPLKHPFYWAPFVLIGNWL